MIKFIIGKNVRVINVNNRLMVNLDPHLSDESFIFNVHHNGECCAYSRRFIFNILNGSVAIYTLNLVQHSMYSVALPSFKV